MPLPEISTTQTRCSPAGFGRADVDHIIVIAAHLAAWRLRAATSVAYSWPVAWEKIKLDVCREREFLFHLLLADGVAEMPGVIESDGRLRDQARAEF